MQLKAIKIIIMLKLLLKKSFFDGWDNILVLFLNNIVFSAMIIGFLFCDNLIVCAVILLLFSVHFLGVNGAAFYFTRSLGKWYEGYIKAIKKIGHLVLFYVIILVIFACIGILIPLYLSIGDFAWTTIGFCLAFCSLIMLVALLYFFPLGIAMEKDKPLKTLHKCFLIMSDNLGVTLYCLMKNICEIFISVFTAFLMPGCSGVAVNQTNIIQLLLLKYDWMEEKKVSKHNVIADQYLAPVIEQYKERNLRTLFVPWKNS